MSMPKVKELVNDIKTLMEKINEDLDKSTYGNKSAAQRARVNSVELSKLLKEYRKESMVL